MRRLVLLAGLGLVIVALAVAQLVLPGIAAQRIRSRLAADGTVRSVSVEAFPAVKLLWHHADTIRVVLSSYRSGSGRVGSLLAELGGVAQLDVTAATLQIGLLRLHDATLRKRGSALAGTAAVTESDLRAAVPFLDGVVPVASGEGALALRGTASVLGLTVSATATVAARGGSVIVVPDVPFGALATLTLFSDPHVSVESVAAVPAAAGFTVSAQARLR